MKKYSLKIKNNKGLRGHRLAGNFRQIESAYNLLKDRNKRRLYDLYGIEVALSGIEPPQELLAEVEVEI